MSLQKHNVIFTKKDSEFAKFFDANIHGLSDNMQAMLAKALMRQARQPEQLAKIVAEEAERL